MIGERVVVFGGTGFVGKHLIKALVDKGYNIRLISGDEKKAKDVMVYGSVGQIEYVQGSISNYSEVGEYIRDCDIVINMVGILHERDQKFHVVHANAVENLVKAVEHVGDMKFIHVSALGVEKVVESKYARSKVNGEKVVRSASEKAVILKPSIMFGRGSSFFDIMGKLSVKLPIVPVIGGNTKVQPLYVGDFVKVIMEVITSGNYWGNTFEVVGPKVYTVKELWNMVIKHVKKNRIMIGIPTFLAVALGIICEWRIVSFVLKPFMGYMEPIVTKDAVLMLEHDNVSDQGICEEMDIDRTCVEDEMDKMMDVYTG